jgi:phage gp29-like protein
MIQPTLWRAGWASPLIWPYLIWNLKNYQVQKFIKFMNMEGERMQVRYDKVFSKNVNLLQIFDV